MKRFYLFIWLILLASLPGLAIDSVREYRKANERRLLQEFIQLLSLPNVASDRVNIRKNADYLLKVMEQSGLKPRLLESANENAY